MPHFTVTASPSVRIVDNSNSAVAVSARVHNRSVADPIDVDKDSSVTSGGGYQVAFGAESEFDVAAGESLWAIAPATKSVAVEVLVT